MSEVQDRNGWRRIILRHSNNADAAVIDCLIRGNVEIVCNLCN